MALTEELAWAAGLIDGEGCVLVSRQKVSRKRQAGKCSAFEGICHTPMLRVQMVHKPTVERLHALFGGTINRSSRSFTPNRRAAWEWSLSGWKWLFPTLKALQPFMVTKRPEVDLMLKSESLWNLKHPGQHGYPQEIRNGREKLWKELQSLKRYEFI